MCCLSDPSPPGAIPVGKRKEKEMPPLLPLPGMALVARTFCFDHPLAMLLTQGHSISKNELPFTMSLDKGEQHQTGGCCTRSNFRASRVCNQWIVKALG